MLHSLLVMGKYYFTNISFSFIFGFQYTDEEVERSYEEFYEDVHTEFLKFGELVNFKVVNCCISFHKYLLL